MDGQEIELKLGLTPEDLASATLRSCFDGGGAIVPRRKHLRSTYFDTPDFALAATGISLRLREVDGGYIQTVKTAGSSASGLFRRAEWEIPAAAGTIDAEHLRQTGLALFNDASIVARLEPVFATHVEREIYKITCGGGEDGGEWEIEAALDLGEVIAGTLSEPISEVELELLKGTPERLFHLAARVLEAVAARPVAASKSERGYRLAMGRIHAPLKGKAPPLSHDMTVAGAFQAIARSCLDHLLANEHCLLATGDGEAIHQMRVALRRLRSALKVFRPMVDGPQLAEVKAGIRWLLTHLGPARDAQVFLSEIVDPVVERHPGENGLALLRAHWQADADARMAEAVEAVKDRRFARLVLELGCWVETGDWLGAPGLPLRRRLAAPIAEYALPRLGKSVQKLISETHAPLSRLAPEEQHLARIRCKQVRYAGEFFASLVPRKHMRVFLAELAELQDVLGQLNDIAVAGPKLSGKQMSGPKAKAAGLVAGWHQSRRAALVAEADKAWKRWRACPLPWDET